MEEVEVSAEEEVATKSGSVCLYIVHTACFNPW